MKVLLIGNLGQIGREILELARAKKVDIKGYDVNDVDIVNGEAVFDLLTKNQDVDVLINAAAYTAVDQAEDEPEKAYAVNSLGVENLALACRKFDIPLFHISTDYVFSGESKKAYSESDLTDPLNIYGKSKLAGEKALEKNWEKNIILRTSWVFGKYGNNFVKTILRLAQEKTALNIVSDQIGCPTAAFDIARVLLELAIKIKSGKEKWGVYNYCGEPSVSWYDFAKKIIEHASNKYEFKLKELNAIKTEDYPTKTKRPKKSELLVQKIIDDFGIQRSFWEEDLKKVIGEIIL